MKAVNLIPGESRRGAGGATPQLAFGPGYALLAVLAAAVGFVTLVVLTGNTIAARKAKLTSVNAQIAEAQARASHLTNYVSFEQLAQTRAETVRQIASARFDWYDALSDLSKVVPANTSLQSLSGSVAPGATTGGGSGGSVAGGGSSLRSDINSPAFELAGCTKTQDDVARLMSRLRLIRGVTRVTLGNSQKPEGTAAAPTSSSSTGSSPAPSGCGANAPSFDIVVFFQPLAGAGSTATGGASPLPASAVTPSAGTPSTGTPSTGAPSTGTPSTGTPSTGAPNVGSPSTAAQTITTPSTAGTPGAGAAASSTATPVSTGGGR